MKIVSGIVALCCLLSAPAFASQSTGRVIGLMPFSSGTFEMLIFRIDTSVAGSPACNTLARYVIRSDSPRYKSTVAAILAAYHAESQVTVWGAATCNNYGDSEDVNFICSGTC